jgi:hypothetical protein
MAISRCLAYSRRRENAVLIGEVHPDPERGRSNGHYAVESNSCNRAMNEVGAVGAGASLGGGIGFGIAADGLAGWGVYTAGMYLTGGAVAITGFGCNTVILNRQSNCWDWCDANFGPGGGTLDRDERRHLRSPSVP